MIPLLFIGAALVAATVVIHLAGFALILQTFLKPRNAMQLSPWPIAWILVRVTWFLLLLHAAEICVWALFYLWWGCLPDQGQFTKGWKRKGVRLRGNGRQYGGD